MEWSVASLSNEQLQRVQDLERNLGVVLIAYSEYNEDSDDRDDGVLTSDAWKKKINWEASKRDRP